MTDQNEREKLVETMALALMPPVSSGNLRMDLRSAARRALLAIEAAGARVVPVELTEDMAAELECQFSTEGQWEAALSVSSYAPDDRAVLLKSGG